MKSSRALPASLLIATFATPALAEIGDTPRRLDPVVTTATPSAAPLTDIPMSVSVIGSDALNLTDAYLGAEDITDLLTGVDAAVANGTQVAFQIRGIGAVDHQALTPTAAAVYSDGVYLATNVQTGLMLYDLDRIEVLKGPQGTLYGRNASGGAINFITARPGSDQTRYVRAGYGNFNRVDLGGAYGNASDNGFSYRLAWRYLSRDAALDNTAGPTSSGCASACSGSMPAAANCLCACIMRKTMASMPRRAMTAWTWATMKSPSQVTACRTRTMPFMACRPNTAASSGAGTSPR